MLIFRTFITASWLVALGSAASGATVSNGGSIAVGDFGIGNGLVDVGQTLSFTYVAKEDVTILDFISVSSVGSSNPADLGAVTYGLVDPDGESTVRSYTTSDIMLNGATTQADGALSALSLQAGDEFAIFFAYSSAGSDTTSHQYTFSTAAPVVIPLPASFSLFMLVLSSIAIAKTGRWRRQARGANDLSIT